jgi:hypothetical protein
MKFRFGSKSAQEVPAPDQTLQALHEELAAKQKQWAEQLAADPASFVDLEQQIHLTFDQLADRCAASLLAQAAQQPACADAAQKK